MQSPAPFAPVDLVGVRTLGLQTVRQASQGVPAQLVGRGALAVRAHRLLGLGADGSARLGQAQPALAAAFGGDVASWGQVGNPWIASRSLARPVETLSSQSSVGWLLANPQGG